MDKKEELTYSQALEELTKIDKQLTDGSISIDELTPKLERAKYLIGVCRQRLKLTEDEINKILKDFEGERTSD
ncbi:MAG: exodeoxyribonuclease VII small subunit [Bacteroidales bacterium]|nr:exodeoxyribonuclease VII small subunit [Bacteroidales bacterium]